MAKCELKKGGKTLCFKKYDISYKGGNFDPFTNKWPRFGLWFGLTDQWRRVVQSLFYCIHPPKSFSKQPVLTPYPTRPSLPPLFQCKKVETRLRTSWNLTSINSNPIDNTHKRGWLRIIIAFPHHPNKWARTNSSKNVSWKNDDI